jgi:hypothetical protein
VFRHMGGVDGYSQRAVEELTAGLEGLPSGVAYVSSYLCDLAAAHAHMGDVTAAGAVLDDVDEIVSALGVARLAGVVSRMRQQIR